jgi:hypothetical protein
MRQTRTESLDAGNIDIGEGKAQEGFLSFTEEPARQSDDAERLRKALGNLNR